MNVVTYADGSAEAIESFTALATYLRDKLRNVEADLGDSEFCQHAGLNAIARLSERRAGLNDVLQVIAPMVERESLDRDQAAAEASDEEQWKALRDDGYDENELRLLSGDR